jgi:glutathione S-transferase
VQYLADLKPQANLAPKQGAPERYRLQEWLNFIATEIHKGFSPLWTLDHVTQNASAREDIRNFAIADLGGKFDVITQKMGSQSYLMPSGFTVADAYLYTILTWTKFLKLDLSRWTSLVGFMERVSARPGVIRALKAERILK